MSELYDYILCAISKRNANLVKEGVAEFAKGGIKDANNKQVKELFNPITPVKKDNLRALMGEGGGGGAASALQWVDLVVNLVNLAATIAGFYLTLTKMESMHGEIKRFIDKYKADQDAEQFEKFQLHLKNMTSHMNYLQKRYTQKEYDKNIFMIRETDIESECNDTASFLERIINQYEKGEIGTELACNIVFTLTPVFARLVNEYCYQYYLIHGIKHEQFETWKSIIEQVNSNEFRDFMRKEMAFNVYYAYISPLKRSAALSVTFDCMQELVDGLENSRKLAEYAPRDMLVPIAELASAKAWDDIRDQIVTDQNETPEEYMNRKIIQMEITDDGTDEIYIPLQISRV